MTRHHAEWVVDTLSADGTWTCKAEVKLGFGTTSDLEKAQNRMKERQAKNE